MIRFRWSDATPSDRPVFLLGSGRCGSTLLQSILNSNREFLIWGEHNGFLRQLAEAYYRAAHPHFPAADSLGVREREKRLRDPDRWIAWDNLCGQDDFRNGFRAFLRSMFADPEGKCPRWGFKEIRYALDADDNSLRLLAEFFPEGRFVILIRNPIQTVFSMIAHWVLVEPGVSLGAAELDEQILSRTVTWTEQYMQLGAFSGAHASRCTSVQYEELHRRETYAALADFLESSSFDYRAHLHRVHGAANKTGAAVGLLRERIELLRPRVEEIARPALLRFGIAASAAGMR
ncbi:MAG TPA: sulfotransferase [Bryobacteraceae bacterium]|nr:sulfotransferase [Bryobacteraceae bacterium]